MDKLLDFLNGSKTYIVGIASVGGGAYLLSQGQSEMGWALISLGLGEMGLAHKGNRIIAALREQPKG